MEIPPFEDEPAPRTGLPDRFGINVGANYAAFAAAALASLVLTPLLLHHLGETAFGIWALAASVVGYLELLELGFGVATTKLVAEDAGVRPRGVIRTLNTNFFVLAVLGVVALGIGLVVSLLAPSWFNVPAALTSETTWTFAILSVALAASIPGDSFGGALGGYQRFDLLGLSILALVVLTSVSSILIVLAGGGLLELALATAVISLGMHWVRWRMLRRLVPGLHLNPRLIDRARIRLTAGLSGWFLLRDVSGTIVDRIDLVVVGVLFGVSDVAIFVVGQKLAKLAEGALVPLAQVFFPHASKLSRDEDKPALARLLVDGTRASLLVGMPATLVLMALAYPAVEAWVGSGFGQAAAVLVVLAAAMGVEALVATSYETLGGMGRARTSAFIATAEAIVNLALSVLLGRAIGLVGVALGTLVAATLIKLPAFIVLTCRAIGLPLVAFLRRALLPTAFPAAGAIAFLLGAGIVVPTTIPAVALVGVAGAVVYFGLYFVFSASATERAQGLAVVTSVGRFVGRNGEEQS